MSPVVAKILISAAVKYVLPRVLDGAEALVQKRQEAKRERPRWSLAKRRAIRREARLQRRTLRDRVPRRVPGSDTADLSDLSEWSD